MKNQHYDHLVELSKHARTLQGIVSHLDWDQETYMPPAAAPIRSEQFKIMAGLIHREKTSDTFSKALSQLIDVPTGEIRSSTLSEEEIAAVKEWRRDYLHDTALPAAFVEEFAKVSSQAVIAWRSAKQANAFQQFAPFLDRLVALNRQKAELLGYSEHPYDALLDQYEPDMTTRQVTNVFEELRKHLTPLIQKMASKPVDDQFLFGNWETSKQIAFSHQLLDAMGYEQDKGRLDFSSHPFSCASHPTDSRITTRIHPNSLMSNIFAVLHEGGHALYEMGLPQNQYGTPLGEARSLGIHESQSRWWETRMGLSLPFWKHFFPLLKETFREQLEPFSLQQFYRAINKVEPCMIRIEADELTYPLHIILRFELEKALIDGSLKVREVPEAWNAKMVEYFNLKPKTNSEGCLQDIHWAMGAIGYFPTYALGNLYAAHLFEKFSQDHPDWEQRVSKGELLFIKQWLADKIYRYGRRYSTLDLLKNATGKPFSADAYVHYLEEKYKAID